MSPDQLTPEAEAAIEKATKLLALHRNNSNEHEAQAALDACMRILEAHNLDMALVERHKGGGATKKREDQRSGGGLYKWQRSVWTEVAKLNFCHYIAIKGLDKGGRYENRVIGSPVNVKSTTLMAEYLQQTIERITRDWAAGKYGRGTSVFIRDAIAYREGMADRICLRLRDLREERLEEDRRRKREQEAAARHPSATPGTALVLADLVLEEDELNQDYLYGWEPGTTTRHRKEWVARRAEATRRAEELLRAREEAEAKDPALRAARLSEEAENAANSAAYYAERMKKEAARVRRAEKEGRDPYAIRPRRSDEARSHTYYDG